MRIRRFRHEVIRFQACRNVNAVWKRRTVSIHFGKSTLSVREFSTFLVENARIWSTQAAVARLRNHRKTGEVNYTHFLSISTAILQRSPHSEKSYNTYYEIYWKQ